MFSGIDLRLAELLAARLCHELAGAITAATNGADLLGEPDLEVDRETLALVGDSARRAGSRLQFYRFAYGYGGNGDAAGPPPRELVAGYFASSRIVCRYGQDVGALLPMQQKLACNLLAFGAEALARGGDIAIGVAASGLRLEVNGEGLSLTREQSLALALKPRVAELTPHTVQAYFTALLAQVLGWRPVAAAAPSRFYITVTPPAR
jgi:histidine phosphotransferase ChpT